MIDCDFPAQWSALSTAQDDPLTLMLADEAGGRIENNTTALSLINQEALRPAIFDMDVWSGGQPDHDPS